MAQVAAGGATAAFDAPARTADRRDGARSGLAPQLWCEARRVVPSPTGTEDCELSWWRSNVLAEPGVQGGAPAVAGRATLGRQCGGGSGFLRAPLPYSLSAGSQEEAGGGGEGGVATEASRADCFAGRAAGAPDPSPAQQGSDSYWVGQEEEEDEEKKEEEAAQIFLSRSSSARAARTGKSGHCSSSPLPGTSCSMSASLLRST